MMGIVDPPKKKGKKKKKGNTGKQQQHTNQSIIKWKMLGLECKAESFKV